MSNPIHPGNHPAGITVAELARLRFDLQTERDGRLAAERERDELRARRQAQDQQDREAYNFKVAGL